jgi:hypothetical protein
VRVARHKNKEAFMHPMRHKYIILKLLLEKNPLFRGMNWSINTYGIVSRVGDPTVFIIS